MRYRFLRYPQGKIKAVTFSYDDGVRQDKVVHRVNSSMIESVCQYY